MQSPLSNSHLLGTADCLSLLTIHFMQCQDLIREFLETPAQFTQLQRAVITRGHSAGVQLPLPNLQFLLFRSPLSSALQMQREQELLFS